MAEAFTAVFTLCMVPPQRKLPCMLHITGLETTALIPMHVLLTPQLDLIAGLAIEYVRKSTGLCELLLCIHQTAGLLQLRPTVVSPALFACSAV
jgi:hypothetical protein